MRMDFLECVTQVRQMRLTENHQADWGVADISNRQIITGAAANYSCCSSVEPR
jgi:hypothetical protein